ncbi:MAG: hypothetical protein COB36_08835 [Alphaproteobacteria bacterium]|nr:MAG: hypothetical protein COB36_08835 [Alphaproteobacteria bacterium]
MVFVGKYAHFENVGNSSLLQLYSRHGEVAREIHQNILREFTGNKDLVVDLVRENPLGADKAMLDKMSEYDVMSVSTEIGMGAVLRGTGLSDKNNVDLYRQHFEQEDMPIYVVAAGNSGQSKRTEAPRVADFSRTSIVVGEANVNDGEPYVEEHSSRINPTLVTDNPFNRGEMYQYYDTSPSLEGHEGLVQEWLVDQELSRQLDVFRAGEGKDLDDSAVGAKYWEIKIQLHDEKYGESPEVQAQLKNFMEHPEQLHTLVMAEVREHKNVDENGYTSEIDGTSFSAPEQAGYVSGAMYEQEQREEKNLPTLMKEEISTLVKMATVDISLREGQDERMHTFNNAANFQFTGPGMHGVFNPEMFRNLLDEAYNKIGNTPDIDRDPVTAVMSADIKEQKGSIPVSIGFDKSVDQNIMVERTHLYMDYAINGLVPHHVAIKQPEQETKYSRIQTSGDGLNFTAWKRDETDFGETLKSGDTWDVQILNGQDTKLTDLSVTVYGYNEGGLMDQMMDYSTEIAPQYMPKPEEPEPAPAQEAIIISNEANANAVGAPPSL